MAPPISRRTLILSALPALLAPRLALADRRSRTVGTYRVDVGVLYGLLTLWLEGSVIEEIDQATGKYRVTMAGEGNGATHRTDAAGVIREGRFWPVETKTYQVLRGRETRIAITYDYERRQVEYHSVGHTLLLGKRRQVDDVVVLPAGQIVDDLFSASLNFTASRIEVDADGAYRTWIIRRAWKENEGPDDVSPSGYRAQLAPLKFRVTPEPDTGRLRGLLDLTSVSSWARAGKPAELTFDARRHLESIRSSLILGTTVTVRLGPAG